MRCYDTVPGVAETRKLKHSHNQYRAAIGGTLGTVFNSWWEAISFYTTLPAGVHSDRIALVHVVVPVLQEVDFQGTEDAVCHPSELG